MLRRACSGPSTRRIVCGTASVAGCRWLTYTPRIRDFQFLFEDVYDMYDHYAKLKTPVEMVNKELMDTLLNESAKTATQTLFPLYETGDDDGCSLKNGTVRTPKGFKEAYHSMKDGCWVGINDPEEYGGQNLPPSVGLVTREIMATANWSFGMYAGLSAGATRTLMAWASDDVKKMYLPKMVSGEWAGTMCLTEPQCGTDLAQVKTKAEPCADGSYKITGTKVFISAGDHDMTENIIHVVLARLPDSKPGTKGLSLFAVPRHVVKADGSLVQEKNVQCTAIEKKMGIKASSTCQLSFDNSQGYLIGEPSKGMQEMFTFMNAARVGCALQGVAHAELAFQNALRYARERGSMRCLGGVKRKEEPNDPIIEHANVRQNILFAKAVAEGGRAFLVDLTRMLDLQEFASSKAEAEKLEQRIGFYTPIAKGCLTEWGVEASSRAMQVWGGHGYIKGNGMEQILRDARIGTIYEGTTGVQALDFIGRKVLGNKSGGEMTAFGNRISQLTRRHIFSMGGLGRYARTLWMLQKQWRVGTARVGILAIKNHDVAANASENFLMLSGYITLGYYWLRMADVAQSKVAAGKDVDGFYQAKLDTCSFYFDHVLPRAEAHYRMMLAPVDICQYRQETWDL